MKIKVPIPVKMIITEKVKVELIKETKENFNQIEIELEQLQFQKKKLLVDAKKKSSNAVSDVEIRMDYEEARRKEKLDSLEIQLSILEKLEEGDIINNGNVEAEFEVNVGDSWNDINNNYAIIVKDGVIVEIRKGNDC